MASAAGTAGHRPWRALRLAAAWNVALHVIGLVLAVAVLRAGTPAAALGSRMAYLAGRPWGWTLGWLVWIGCAVALVAFMALLARTRPSPLTRAAARVATLGALIDVGCDLAYAWALPDRAGGDPALFLVFERRLTLASLTMANGLYTVAVALATVGLASPLGRRLGALTVVGGTALAVAGITGDPHQVAASTAVTIPAFLAWTVVVSRAPR